MTGTSIDGVDVAAVLVRGRGLKVRGELLSTASASLGELAPRLRAAHRQDPLTAGEFSRLARDIALAHVAPMRELESRHGRPDLAVVHGQTLFHAPPHSLQLVDPHALAHALGCEVITGLRGADLAAGGQGAPITPLSDWMMFRSRSEPRFIVNLGGFANATFLPSATETFDSWIAGIRGFDLCLCNQWLDSICRETMGRPFDDGGLVAQSGTANRDALMTASGILDQQRRSRRSLGTNDEALATLSRSLQGLSPPDALSSACQAIAATITAAVQENEESNPSARPTRVFVAGGGARNAALVGAISVGMRRIAKPTDSLGVPIDAREAMAMALLGAAAADGAAITLSAVTGRTNGHSAHCVRAGKLNSFT